MHQQLSLAKNVLAAARRLSFIFLFLFLLSAGGLAQIAPICDATCTPDPTGSSYAGAAAARPKILNARGHLSALVAKAAALSNGGPPTATLVGSQSYNYAIPIVNLVGRAGLDLSLNLYYNSRIWDVDTVDGLITFNADRDFPSYGFRLDFGYLENIGGAFVLTESDGTKRLLSQGTDSTKPYMFYSTDGSHVQYNNSTVTLTYKNGRAVQYQPFPSNAVLLRPISIKDINGNYITITYLSGHDQLISTVTDTLGRIINFVYDSANHLSSLKQNLESSGTKTLATFTWGSPYASGYTWYNFSGLTVSSAPTASQFQALTGCTYPNGTGYRFTYGDWGIIDKIEMLTAGSSPATRSYVSYNYPAVANGALTDAPAYTQQTISPDGGSDNNSAWSYSVTKNGTGVVTSMTVTDPTGTATTTNLDATTGLTSSVQIADGNGVLQRKLDYTWTTTGAAPQSTVLASVVTTLEDGKKQSKVAYAYDPWANVTDLYQYDFGLAQMRHVVTTFLTTGNYVTLHIVNLPTQILVKDGSDKIIARTDLKYDETTPTSVTSAASHDDTNFSSSFNTRGNLTSITRYSNAAAGTGSVKRGFSYDTLGNLITAQLDCCNQKTFSFSSATAYSEPDSVTRGPSAGPQFTSSFTYDPDTGLPLSSTDENGQETVYQYDSMNRLTKTTLPAQNGTSVALNTAYDDNAVAPTVTNSNGANNAVTVTTLDGLGHVMQVDTKNGSNLVSTIKYKYDQLWRRTSVSNPFGPADSEVDTTFTYDSLGRTLQVAPPSGGSLQYSYSDNTVTVTDPAGRQLRKTSDALGRLVEVDEPVPGKPVNAGSGSSTINGTEQSAQVLVSPAAAGSGSVSVSGSVAWKVVSSNASTGGTTNITINGAEQQYPAGVIAGTGSVTLSGTEQVIPAVAATATVNVTGNLQSKQLQTQTATQATGSVTISGSEQSVYQPGRSILRGLRHQWKLRRLGDESWYLCLRCWHHLHHRKRPFRRLQLRPE